METLNDELWHWLSGCKMCRLKECNCINLPLFWDSERKSQKFWHWTLYVSFFF
jgi:hypothetical protein